MRDSNEFDSLLLRDRTQPKDHPEMGDLLSLINKLLIQFLSSSLKDVLGG